MFTLLLLLYCAFFTLLAHKNFRFAVGLFIIGLPTYLIRFKLGPLPTTLLELMLGILFLVWLIKYARSDRKNIQYLISNHNYLSISIVLFFISSLVSIFVSDMWFKSLGQWRAYFLEPIIVFVMLIGRTARPHLNPLLCEGEAEPIIPSPPQRRGQGEVSPSDLIWFLALSTVSIGLFGIAQRFTGWHIGNVDWVALQTHRVTSFFLSPNAVGLYLGPIVLLMLGQIVKNKTQKISNIQFPIITLSLITIFLTKSLGALIAVTIGTLLFAYLIGYKKPALTATVIAVIIAISLSPYLLIYKSQSTANRLTLWSYTSEFLAKSPKNFIFGAGIRQFFRKVQKPHYDVKKMERLIYPHNIFLNFWTETGLLGMLSFVSASCFMLHISYKTYKQSDKILGAALLSSLLIIFLHGSIDVPYFKNDLAMLFWILTACVIASEARASQSPNIQN